MDSHLFDGLNDVPWPDLSSAYGNADELPIWIRRLVSEDAAVRANAAKRIGAEVEHQGSLYTASAAVMPFLVRLLRAPQLKGKGDILSIVGVIAHAAVAAVAYEGEEGAYGPDGILVSYTLGLVRKELPAVIPVAAALLDAPEPQIRMEAAWVLSRIPERSSELCPTLLAAYEHEANEAARANLVLALASLSRPIPEELRFFEDTMRSCEGELVRFAAAMALARSAKGDAPRDALHPLALGVTSESEALAAYCDLPCGEGAPWYAAMRALRAVGFKRLSFMLPQLQLSISTSTYYEDWELVVFLLFVAFGDVLWSGEGARPASSLAREQRDALGVILNRPDLWHIGNIWGAWGALRMRGLPNKPEDLAAYLGVALPPSRATRREQPATGRIQSPLERYRKHINEAFPDLLISVISGKWKDVGQNNDVVEVNHTLLFRFPKHPRAVEEMAREIALLRALQGRLPLSIPDPAYSSTEPREVGRAFMGYAKLPGKPLYREMLESVPGEGTVARLATQLGGFLRTLHATPPDAFDFVLPVAAGRETWERMYADIRERLFPRMRPDARERVAAHFEPYLADARNFAYAPALIHGDFGPSNILYDARARSIGGIIDWSGAGLGDPANDIAALIYPAGYSEGFARRLEPAYPGVADMLPRARFYAGTFALQEALFGLETGDAKALAAGLADYV